MYTKLIFFISSRKMLAVELLLYANEAGSLKQSLADILALPPLPDCPS